MAQVAVDGLLDSSAPTGQQTRLRASTPVAPAFDDVYRDNVQEVARWAARLGGNAIDVEDTVQEIFALVQQLLPKYSPDAKLTTWLFRITENVVRHQRRAAWWRKWLGGSAEDVAADRPSAQPSAHDTAEQKQAHERVYRVLDGLNERYRTALILFRLEELSGAEVAERLGITEKNVWVLLHRARKAFARRLEKLEGPHG